MNRCPYCRHRVTIMWGVLYEHGSPEFHVCADYDGRIERPQPVPPLPPVRSESSAA